MPQSVDLLARAPVSSSPLRRSEAGPTPPTAAQPTASPPALPLPPTRKDRSKARHGHSAKSELAATVSDTQQIFQSLHGGVTGRRKDLSSVFSALDGKDAGELAAIDAAYERHYGKDLSSDVLGRAGRKNRDEALARLNGDSATADAIRIRGLMPVLGNHSGELFEFLSTKSAPELHAISEEYSRLFGSVSRAIKLRLHGADKKRALELLAKPELEGEARLGRADALALKEAFKGKIKKNQIFEILATDSSDGKRAALIEHFSEKSKRSLEKTIDKKLKGVDRQYAHALLNGDAAGAAACLLQRQLQRRIVRPKLVLAVLEEGVDPTALREAYTALFGDIDGELAKHLKGRTLEQAQLMLQDEGLSKADAIYFAAQGLRPDVDKLRALLDGMSAGEVEGLRAQFFERRAEPLDDFLLSKVRGRSKVDLEHLLKGSPADAAETVQRMKEKVAVEQSGLGGKAISFIHRRTVGTSALDRLRRDLRTAEHMLEMAENPTRLEELNLFVEGDIDANREAVRALSNATGNMAVLAAGTALTLATGGLATPATLAVVAAGGAATKVGTKALLEGAGYETWRSDALHGGAVAATMPVIQFLKPIPVVFPGLRGAVLRGVMMGGTIGGFTQAVDSSVRPETWEEGFRLGLKTTSRSFMRGAALGAVSGAVMSAALKGIQMARNISHVRSQLALLAENPNFSEMLTDPRLKEALYEGMVIVEDGATVGSNALKKMLQEGRVVGEEVLDGGVGTVGKKILKLECSDGVERRVVFKSIAGENKLLMFDRGSPIGTAWRREIGMSRLAEVVGATDVVPETVAFVHEGSLGSAQLFVEGGKTLASQNGTRMIFDSVQGEKMRILSGLAGETDFHKENVLVRVSEAAAEGEPVTATFSKIDSGLAFPGKNVPKAMFPRQLVNGAMGPLSDEGMAFLNSIQREEVVRALLSSGIDEEGAAYALGRLQLMKRQPDVLNGVPIGDVGRAQKWIQDHGPWKEFFEMQREMIGGVDGLKEVDLVTTKVPLRELWDGALRQEVRKAYG